MTDPYLNDDGVLHNRLGLRDAETLQRAEADFSKLRLYELETGIGPRGTFDSRHLRDLHRHLFQDVYAWAGYTRGDEIDLNGVRSTAAPLLMKGDTVFEVSHRVNSSLERLLESVTDTGWRGLSRFEFSTRAADLLGELNRIHPFREGNGRTQRAFLSELARDAGHGLSWDVVSQERLIASSIASSRGDLEAMRRLLSEITDPARVEALRGAIRFLDTQKINWNERYLATAVPGEFYEGVVVASQSRHTVVFSSNQQIIVVRTVDLRDRGEGTVQFMAEE